MVEGKTVSAIILAAGSSIRYGAVDKLYQPLGDTLLLCHSVRAFLDCPMVDEVILVVRAQQQEFCRQLFAADNGIKIITGGQTRCGSALLGLKVATGEVTLTHDGARPFVTKEIIQCCLMGALEIGAAAAAIPAVDTIKICDNDHMVVETTSRCHTWQVQSPQAFLRPKLLEAYSRIDANDPKFTDDCMVMEAAGYSVKLVKGSRGNFKITTPEDYEEALAWGQRLGLFHHGYLEIRTGIGQDSHRFAPNDRVKPLVLGGVPIPGHMPLEANSDGDVLLHALCNAISGITGENILGAKADAICQSGIQDSRVYVQEALKYLKGRLVHLSFTVECKTPHLAAYIPQIRSEIGKLVGLPERRVGLTATSGEGLTDFGRGLGISVFCVATAEGVF